MKNLFFAVLLLLSVFLSAGAAESSDVIIVGDIRLKPVYEIISGIRSTLRSDIKVYSPFDVQGRLAAVVSAEGARVVISLGRDALDEAIRLPESVAVVYDLVILPSRYSRRNISGFYMATPVGEYIGFLRQYFPSLKSIAALGDRDMLRTLGASGYSEISPYQVRNSVDLINAVRQLDSADAILILPDIGLLTESALHEVLLHSFRKAIPVLGVSERHVKQGALMALVFDPVSEGRQIGERAEAALRGDDIGRIPASSCTKFDLFLNIDTAKKMNINVPEDMQRRAARIYQ